MLGLLARAAQAVGRLLTSAAARQRVVTAARNVGQAAANVGRKATRACKVWQRNRAIRQAYNARRKQLKNEISAMRKAGKSRREIAERAHKFRHDERMRAREQMRKNGDKDLVDKLEARDKKLYGNKDGPDFKHVEAKARKKLSEKLGRQPTDDEVCDAIAESATRTDWATNLKFLSF